VGMSGDGSSRRFDIVAETRRRWSEPEKNAIVAEASGPCTNVSAVARRHGIKPPLLFRWIKERADAVAGSKSSSFMPVVVPRLAAAGKAAVDEPAAKDAQPAAAAGASRSVPQSASGTIEIALHNGRRVRVCANMDGDTLKRIIDLLEG
jgi:transposase